jgi:hypothetical protein
MPVHRLIPGAGILMNRDELSAIRKRWLEGTELECYHRIVRSVTFQGDADWAACLECGRLFDLKKADDSHRPFTP